MSLPQPPVDPPEWLRTLPEAPEYYPTAAEFADPVAYILKIEPQASFYGICKIVPPLPAPPRDATVRRLRESFASNAAALGDAAPAPTFTTRVQQVGLDTRNRRPASRGVRESGERYTLEAFRARARDYELPRHAVPPRNATPLQLEALFWAACAARPFNVEYGNDMPGSGFARPEEVEPELDAGGNAAPRDVGETEWNMRVAPRARGSLLRAMGWDVAGVTTPMLYVAMLYSWFAWHVEDHELHSLNYLHFGKPKTWYGVPRDAMLAFEDAVSVHGYADDLNAIMAFKTLNKKTTLLSPEVLLSAGIPCCRLVQHPGEFVITFPGAYHSGFSHGYNCGEATNIATPLWLQVAKEAAIRRASTNCGPMVSHYQLLYELALSLRAREPKDFHAVPRSSRLRNKKNKNEGDKMIKDYFVKSVIENNSLLSVLLDKSSCIIVPEITFPLPYLSEHEVTVKQNSTADACSISQQAAEDMSADVSLEKITGIEKMSGPQSITGASATACSKRKLYETKHGKLDPAAFCLSTSEAKSGVMIDKDISHRGGGLLDKGRLPCVQCGILSFACVAIIQPREAAVQFLISGESNSSNASLGEINKSDNISDWTTEHCERVPQQGQASGTYDNLIQSVNVAHVSDRCRQLYSSNTNGCASALGLLASAYESSDSEEERTDNVPTDGEKNVGTSVSCSSTAQHRNSNLNLYEEECEARSTSPLMKSIEHKSSRDGDIGHFTGLEDPGTSHEQCSEYLDLVDDVPVSCVNTSSDTRLNTAKSSLGPDTLRVLKYGKDSCRMHVFCLEHALETWKQLQRFGGANIMLLCHRDYPRAESAAKEIAPELGLEPDWKNITFEEATEKDIRRVQLALQDEQSQPTSSDWAVKMGINIYYSAEQSERTLFSKQIPYNSIIYKAFGQENPDDSTDYAGQRSGAAKKRMVGWWCGKSWMSNQVHPFLAREREEPNHGNKAMFSANSHNKVQDAPLKRCTALINHSPSKSTPRRKRRDSNEKSRAKKKRCASSDEAALHRAGLGMKSEAIHDQPVNFDDYVKHEEGDEIEEELISQKYKHKLQNMNRKSSSQKQKDDADIDCLLGIDNSTIGNLDNCPQQGLNAVETEGKLQGNKGKSIKGKVSDDSWNGHKKLEKMNKKPVSRKQKNGRINRQFLEDQGEDNTVDNLFNVDSVDETILYNWNEVQEEKTDHVKVECRGKRRSGKDDKRNSNFHESSDEEDIDMDCFFNTDSGDDTTIGNLDNSPPRTLDAVKVKSRGKFQGSKTKSSKGKATGDSSNGGRKLQKMNGKSSCKKEKNDWISEQFIGGHNTMGYLLNGESRDEVTLDNWDKAREEKTKSKNSKRHASGDKIAKFPCDIEGCDMSFSTQQDLSLHKRDICPVKGCKKKFFCHKYLLQHRKVHIDDRPLKCAWKGCKKTFKWPWARTEHMRVHTGVRPYECKEPGCTQTFRFVSDFSRHKRKTGHCNVKKNST